MGSFCDFESRLVVDKIFSVFMGYFSADKVRWIPFFGVPLAFSAIYEDTSSVTPLLLIVFWPFSFSSGPRLELLSGRWLSK